MNNNFVINKKNNNKIYLTETESEILKTLFKKKLVKKEKLKKDILNLNPALDTKSLESHLSRIRKKLININSNISIVSTNNEFIEAI